MDFELFFEMSIPDSFRIATAQGCTVPLGSEPALSMRACSEKTAFARPSAIWLRAELATQRKRMFRCFFTSNSHFNPAPKIHDAVLSLARKDFRSRAESVRLWLFPSLNFAGELL